MSTIENEQAINARTGARLKARVALQLAVDRYNAAADSCLLLPCAPDILEMHIRLARDKGLPEIADELHAAAEMEQLAA